MNNTLVEKYMRQCLDLALIAQEKGEVPVGSVLVYKNAVIAQSHNMTLCDKDPCAHAEILVIRKGGQIVGIRSLAECSLYTSLEPCLMCTGAIIQAKIANLYFASFSPNHGASHHLYSQTQVFPTTITCKESSYILKSFFSKLRTKTHSYHEDQ